MSCGNSNSQCGRNLNPNKPSPTVVCNNGTPFAHITEERLMTPHEMARLQTFPDKYRFHGPLSKDVVDEDGKLLRHSGVWEELTNAVPPLFARVLCSRIAEVLVARRSCRP